MSLKKVLWIGKEETETHEKNKTETHATQKKLLPMKTTNY